MVEANNPVLFLVISVHPLAYFTEPAEIGRSFDRSISCGANGESSGGESSFQLKLCDNFFIQ
jgi:hypothetical protein